MKHPIIKLLVLILAMSAFSLTLCIVRAFHPPSSEAGAGNLSAPAFILPSQADVQRELVRRGYKIK